MDERAPRDVEPVQGSSDRRFGLVFALVFLLVGLQPLFRAQSVRPWALIASGVFLTAALGLPRLLAPLNRIWTAVGLVLHAVMSPVALAILFYGAITPTGLLMRLFGKDPLRLRRDSSIASYWIVRTPPGPAPESLRNQF